MQVIFDSAALPALVAGGVAISVALLLVLTQRWHRHLSIHSDQGVQKFHTYPTGAIMWLAALLPAFIAVQWPTDTFRLVMGFVFCAVLYSSVYARLTQFRWCYRPATLAFKAA